MIRNLNDLKKGIDFKHLPLSFNLKGVRIHTVPGMATRFNLFNPALTFVVSGKKNLAWGDNNLVVDEGNAYLSFASIPQKCEFVPSDGHPYIEIQVDINDPCLYEIIYAVIDTKENTKLINTLIPRGIETFTINEQVWDVIGRLVLCINHSYESKILGSDYKRELFYRVLECEQALPLWALAFSSSRLARMSSAVNWLSRCWTSDFNLDQTLSDLKIGRKTFLKSIKKLTGSSLPQFLGEIEILNQKTIQ